MTQIRYDLKAQFEISSGTIFLIINLVLLSTVLRPEAVLEFLRNKSSFKRALFFSFVCMFVYLLVYLFVYYLGVGVVGTLVLASVLLP